MNDKPGFWVGFKAAQGESVPDIHGCKIQVLPNIGDVMRFPRWLPESKYIVEGVEHDILAEEGPNDIFIVLRKA